MFEDLVKRLRYGPAPLGDPNLNDNAADEITALRAQVAALQQRIGECEGAHEVGARAIAENAELRAQVAALREDAELYRYLRAGAPRTTGSPKSGRIEVLRWEDRTEASVLKGEALDAAIRAARSKA